MFSQTTYEIFRCLQVYLFNFRSQGEHVDVQREEHFFRTRGLSMQEADEEVRKNLVSTGPKERTGEMPPEGGSLRRGPTLE